MLIILMLTLHKGSLKSNLYTLSRELLLCRLSSKIKNSRKVSRHSLLLDQETQLSLEEKGVFRKKLKASYSLYYISITVATLERNQAFRKHYTPDRSLFLQIFFKALKP